MFTGIGLIPPATAVNYIPWAIIGFIFQYILRRKHFATWAKYNCKASLSLLDGLELTCYADVLSAALDAGTAIGTILVYFWCVSPATKSENSDPAGRQLAIPSKRRHRQ